MEPHSYCPIRFAWWGCYAATRQWQWLRGLSLSFPFIITEQHIEPCLLHQVFTCLFMDYISSGLQLLFNASDMPFMRHRITADILRKCLWYVNSHNASILTASCPDDEGASTLIIVTKNRDIWSSLFLFCGLLEMRQSADWALSGQPPFAVWLSPSIHGIFYIRDTGNGISYSL